MYAKLDRMLSAFDIYEREMLLRGAIVRQSTSPEMAIIQALRVEIDLYIQFKEKGAKTDGNA